MPRRTMVLLSGGMDSTWSLWKVLSETDDEVFAVYLDCHKNNRGLSEKQAARDISALLSKMCRSITFHIAPAIRPIINTRTPNIALFYASLIAAGSGFGKNDRILTGRNADDDETAFWFPLWWEPERSRRADISKQAPLHKMRQTMVDLLFEDDIERPEYTRLEPFPTRVQMIEELPPEVLALTVGCSNPRLINDQWVPCGSDREWRDAFTEGNYNKECLKCSILSKWLPRYRPENGWIARSDG